MKPAVLIIDDEAIVRISLEALLSGEGYDLFFANDGVSGLAKAAEILPDVILLDVMMPGMDGFDVCRKLRGDEVLKDVPVLFVTALDDREARLEGISVGADDFLIKPIDSVELRARLKTITRLNRYRRMLAEKARFERLIELFPDGILLVDTQFKIQLANPAILSMLEIAGGSGLIGEYLLDRVPGRDFERWRQYLEGILHTPNHSARLEATMKAENGALVPVEITAGQATWENQPLIQMVLRDIRERIAAEKTLAAAQKMADLGVLAAGIAHEVMSPIQVIVGLSERDQKNIDGGKIEVERIARDLKTIQRNGWRIAEIVNSLLSYARTSSEQMEPYDLNQVVRETLQLIEHQVQTWSGIHLQVDLEERLPHLLCDPRKIGQVLINLLTNAHDAIPEDGTITIRTRHDAASRQVLLQISDTGIGIQKDDRERIWEPFFTTKLVGKGTGLGLSVVRGIIAAHAGVIEVESKPDRGTLFTLRFPAAIKP